MAVSNCTQSPALPVCQAFGANVVSSVSHEKISCLMPDGSMIDPFSLMGLHLRFAELLEIDNGIGEHSVLESSLCTGVVVGVLIGSSSHNVATELLIIPDGYTDPDFVALDRLTVLSVL